MGVCPTNFDPRISALIKHKVQRLVGSYCFTSSDVDDVAQDLTIHVWTQLGNYDPSRASVMTYADRIVAYKIGQIIEHATAQKRDRRRERRIDDLPQSALPKYPPQQERVDTALDVNEALPGLSADLRQVAALFMKHGREAPVIRESRLGRQRVRGMRGRIKSQLVARGLS